MFDNIAMTEERVIVLSIIDHGESFTILILFCSAKVLTRHRMSKLVI